MHRKLVPCTQAVPKHDKWAVRQTFEQDRNHSSRLSASNNYIPSLQRLTRDVESPKVSTA